MNTRKRLVKNTTHRCYHLSTYCQPIAMTLEQPLGHLILITFFSILVLHPSVGLSVLQVRVPRRVRRPGLEMCAVEAEESAPLRAAEAGAHQGHQTKQPPGRGSYLLYICLSFYNNQNKATDLIT